MSNDITTEIEMDLGYENDDEHEAWFSRGQVYYDLNDPDSDDFKLYIPKAKWVAMGCPHYIKLNIKAGTGR